MTDENFCSRSAASGDASRRAAGSGGKTAGQSAAGPESLRRETGPARHTLTDRHSQGRARCRRARSGYAAHLDESFEVQPGRRTFYLIGRCRPPRPMEALREGLVNIVGYRFSHATDSLLAGGGRQQAVKPPLRAGAKYPITPMRNNVLRRATAQRTSDLTSDTFGRF